MKFKELPGEVKFEEFKLKLPNNVYDNSSLPMYNIKNTPVHLVGWVMGDFFVKLNSKDTKIYPMFWNELPNDIYEWEVVGYKK